MKYNLFRIAFHLLTAVFLTLTTQVGGLIYIFSVFKFPKVKKNYRIKRIALFSILYLTSSYLIIPNIAPLFGRIQIENSNILKPHNFITKLCNRNYITPKLNIVLKAVSKNLNKEFPKIKLIYLDANFPFFDGFPLLPHLSHNDGKKIDLSFIYVDTANHLTNLKPSNSGYGVYSTSTKNEFNQTNICIEKGYWQYDFTKYLTFGQSKKELKISKTATAKLIQLLLEKKEVSKLFIEPHLKKRLNLNNSKIRFHGCQAVRHDDHIHFQIR